MVCVVVVLCGDLLRVVYLVIGMFEGLSRTQLVKLVFCIDREYFRLFGVSLTGVEYIMYFFGVYSYSFKDVLNWLLDGGFVYEVFVSGRYHIYLGDEVLRVEPFNSDELVAVKSAVELLGDGSGGLLSGDEMRRVIYLFDEVRGVRLFDRIVFR